MIVCLAIHPISTDKYQHILTINTQSGGILIGWRTILRLVCINAFHNYVRKFVLLEILFT